tara:strand:+ start:374 stop:739 length:366 start_codon:yes stop_codon:yes gene_type:complete
MVSEIIDTRGFDSLEFIILAGIMADADVTHTILVEDGDDSSLSDNAAVIDDQLLGTEVLASFSFDDDGEIRKIGYIGAKRYVRMTITPAGNTGAEVVAVLAAQSNADFRPVTDQGQGGASS